MFWGNRNIKCWLYSKVELNNYMQNTTILILVKTTYNDAKGRWQKPTVMKTWLKILRWCADHLMRRASPGWVPHACDFIIFYDEGKFAPGLVKIKQTNKHRNK